MNIGKKSRTYFVTDISEILFYLESRKITFAFRSADNSAILHYFDIEISGVMPLGGNLPTIVKRGFNEKNSESENLKLFSDLKRIFGVSKKKAIEKYSN